MKSPKILAIGGAHMVRRGQVSGDYTAGACNAGVMREDIGGCAFNALRIATRRGASGVMFSVRGGDIAGEAVSRAITSEGIADLSVVFLDRKTPSHTALLNRDGCLIAGLADTGLYNLAFPKQMRRSKMREAVAQSDAILCDDTLPAVAIGKLIEVAAGKPLFAIATSQADATHFEDGLSRLTCLFMKREAATVLSGTEHGDHMTSRLRERRLACGVVTESDGSVIGFKGNEIFSIVPFPAEKALETADSLSALAGATVVALLRGLPLREAVREGAAAAAMATQGGNLLKSKRDFTKTLALVPQATEVRPFSQ